ALEKAQCYVNRNVLREQHDLLQLVSPKEKDGAPTADARVSSFERLVRDVLQWAETDLVVPDATYDVPLPEDGEVLHPDFIIPAEGADGPVALISVVPATTNLDKPRSDTAWHASPEARLERMLREANIPIGLLFNGTHVRLVYAPRGESSGHATFDVVAMCKP